MGFSRLLCIMRLAFRHPSFMPLKFQLHASMHFALEYRNSTIWFLLLCLFVTPFMQLVLVCIEKERYKKKMLTANINMQKSLTNSACILFFFLSVFFCRVLAFRAEVWVRSENRNEEIQQIMQAARFLLLHIESIMQRWESPGISRFGGYTFTSRANWWTESLI